MSAESIRPYDLLDLRWFGDDDHKDTDETETVDDKDVIEDTEVDEVLPDQIEVNVDEIEDAKELRLIIKQLNDEKNNLSVSNKKVASIARERLHEIMEKKAKMKEIQDKDDKDKLDQLKEKEEFKKVLEEVEPKYDVLKKDAAKTLIYFSERFETLKETLPEEYHDLIPAGDIRDQITWLQKFQESVTSKLNADGSGEGSDKSTVPEKKPNVGGKDKPPDKTETRPDVRRIEDQIANCKNQEELEALLQGYQPAK